MFNEIFRKSKKISLFLFTICYREDLPDSVWP